MNWRAVLLVLITVVVFWFIKFYLGFPTADIGFVGVILTISSILFGLLAGFFISEMWGRYTEIREIEGVRSSEEFNMIKYAGHFFKNKKFEKEFKLKMEKAAIAEESIRWDEGHLSVPYFRDVESSFGSIKVKSKKDQNYFENLLDSYNTLVKTTVRLDTLYKERLFATEWLIMLVLSLVIAVSVLFLDPVTIFTQIIIIVFPTIIALTLSILYDLDRMVWSRGLITIEPIEKILDAIGAKRYYIKSDLKYIPKKEKSYRTEDDLKGELRQVYLDIIKKRKS